MITGITDNNWPTEQRSKVWVQSVQHLTLSLWGNMIFCLHDTPMSEQELSLWPNMLGPICPVCKWKSIWDDILAHTSLFWNCWSFLTFKHFLHFAMLCLSMFLSTSPCLVYGHLLKERWFSEYSPSILPSKAPSTSLQ